MTFHLTASTNTRQEMCQDVEFITRSLSPTRQHFLTRKFYPTVFAIQPSSGRQQHQPRRCCLTTLEDIDRSDRPRTDPLARGSMITMRASRSKVVSSMANGTDSSEAFNQVKCLGVIRLSVHGPHDWRCWRLAKALAGCAPMSPPESGPESFTLWAKLSNGPTRRSTSATAQPKAK